MTTPWNERTCAFCGIGSKAYISIRIDVPNPEAPPEYSYTETDMCKKCWAEMGIKAAFEHNREIREVAGVEQEKEEANARLIATAPDLLKAAEALIIWCLRQTLVQTLGEPQEVIRLKEIIAKAKGEADV